MFIYQNEVVLREHHMLKGGVSTARPGHTLKNHSVYVAVKEYNIRYITDIQNRYWNMLYCCMRM
jgi:hypothetical protein